MTDQGETPLEQRVERLEQGQQTQNTKLDEILARLTGTKPKPDGDSGQPAGRPGTVEEQVRAELARAEQERASQQAAADDKEQRETLAQRLAKLEERAPEPPQPRRERLMWGSR